MATTQSSRNNQGFKPPKSAKKKGGSDTPSFSGDDSSGRGFTLAIIALVILGMAGVAFLATQRDSTLTTAPQTSEVEVEGSPMLPYPSGPNGESLAQTNAAVDGAVGNPAPALRGTDFNDDEVVIEADGRLKAVYFLAHHCPFCQNEVPVVQRLVDDGVLPSNMDIYAVSTGVRPNQGANNFPPESWLLRENWSSPVMRDSETNTAFNAYGGASFPYVVYLDGDNNVVTRTAGEKSAEETTVLWAQFSSGVLDNIQTSTGGSTDADADPAEAEPAEDVEEQ